jgi:hypothetical protein
MNWVDEADRNKKLCAKYLKTRINDPFEVSRLICAYNVKYVLIKKDLMG